MKNEEIQRKAASGAVKLSSAGPCRMLPDFESVTVCPAQMHGGFPKDIFEGIETDVVIGEKRASNPLVLQTPVFVPGASYGEVGKPARLSLAYGAALSGTAYATGEGGILPEEREICKQFHGKSIVSWGPARYGVTTDYLRAADAVVIEMFGGGRGCFSELLKAERVTPLMAQLYNAPAGADLITPPRHLDMDTPEDLKNHILLLRELTDHRVPILVRMGASRVYEEVRLAIESDADAVWLDALETPLYSAPQVIINEAGTPILALFAPARRAFEDTGGKEKGVKLLVTGGMFDGADIFKALALGADAVGIPEATRLAMGCKEPGEGACHTGKCPAGIATLDPALEARLDWKAGGKSIANLINALTDEVKLLTASTGHTSIRAVSPEDLRAISYDCAAMTGLKLAGYDRQLPMWMH